ncbi:hypothetical protein AMECASPLE_039582 [Ameca splendens]|uniref:Uncharacterized protein n=1 Tax=Ameca splendens TaxID=208324 RepID=A0ABV1AFS0_9TELE
MTSTVSKDFIDAEHEEVSLQKLQLASDIPDLLCSSHRISAKSKKNSWSLPTLYLFLLYNSVRIYMTT